MALVKWVTTNKEKYNALVTKDANAIYFVEDEGKIYKGDTCFSKTTKVPTFVVPNVVMNGLQSIMLQIKEGGKIEDISALCTVAGSEDCEIDIEKISKTNYDLGGSWTSIFSSNNNIKIKAGRLSNSSSPSYVLASDIVSPGDIFRLNVINNGKTISGLNLQITVKI